MSIDIYASVMMYFFTGLFLLSILTGVIVTVMKIRKKTVKYWWIIPCTIIYAVVAAYNLFIPYIAYDDPADPNYRTFKNWGLRDFMLNDCKMLIIFLLAILLLYFVWKRKKYSIKANGLAVMIAFAILSVVVILFTFVDNFFPGGEKKPLTMRVEGFDVTYDASGRKITMEEIEDIAWGSSIYEISDKLGEPDTWIGCGFLSPVYFVEKNRAVVFYFTYPGVCEGLELIVLVDEDGESQILKEE